MTRFYRSSTTRISSPQKSPSRKQPSKKIPTYRTPPVTYPGPNPSPPIYGFGNPPSYLGYMGTVCFFPWVFPRKFPRGKFRSPRFHLPRPLQLQQRRPPPPGSTSSTFLSSTPAPPGAANAAVGRTEKDDGCRSASRMALRRSVI